MRSGLLGNPRHQRLAYTWRGVFYGSLTWPIFCAVCSVVAYAISQRTPHYRYHRSRL